MSCSSSSSGDKTGAKGAKTGQNWKYTVYFDPEADRKLGEDYEMTDEQLIKRMSKLVDVTEKIQNVYAYTSPLGWWQITKFVFYHRFIVLQTRNYFWSIEKHSDRITIQRASKLENVQGRYRHDTRFTGLSGITLEKSTTGKKGIQQLINWLYENNELNQSYHYLESNCQDFAERVYNYVTT